MGVFLCRICGTSPEIRTPSFLNLSHFYVISETYPYHLRWNAKNITHLCRHKCGDILL